MKMRMATVVACVAGLAWPAGLVHAAPGDPVSGAEVGLEQDPGPGDTVLIGTTDREGSVTFSGLKPGRYRVMVIDRAQLKVPVRLTISGAATAAPVVSQPISEGQAGSKAYALGRDGKWVLTEVGGPNPQPGVTANVTAGTIKVKVESTR
jgi:hypothetical protein